MKDSFPEWVTRVRKDPLGFSGYNKLLDGFRWVDDLVAREHLRRNSDALHNGEHNAAEIPREVGGIYQSSGAQLEGFNRVVSVTNTTHGGRKLTALTLDPTPYPAIRQMSLQLTPMSESGINKPCVAMANLVSTSELRVYCRTLHDALGAGNTWDDEDAAFGLAIHATPLPQGQPYIPGSTKLKGDNLTSGALDWNLQCEADTVLRDAILAEHTSAGVHTNREVARTWTSVKVTSGGGGYDLFDSSLRNPCSAINYTSTGIVELEFTNAWALSAQPFVSLGYDSANGDAGSFYCVVCPRSLITTTAVTFYIYQYDVAANTWARADADFFVAIHADSP